MTNKIRGIHHVTAIAGEAQKNVDFYAGLLGLRLVKRTVNFDDPGTYHLYYGDGAGTPGTILTFFPYENARAGKSGRGQASAVALAVPVGSLEFWMNRLAAEAVHFDGPWSRFGENGITVLDPDGLRVELVESETSVHGSAWDGSDVPIEHAVRGVHSVTLELFELPRTREILEFMGYRETTNEERRTRFSSNEDAIGSVLDVTTGSTERGRGAAGTIHHVAFRVSDDDEQRQWLEEISQRVSSVSPVMNRDYFRSIYFREPEGVLFELATDGPGFAVDEPAETLGEKLQLPEWLEEQRERIERRLPPISLPKVVSR